MKPEQITETLEQAAKQMGVQVRYETMTGEVSGGGGLCKVKGQWCVIIDRKVAPSERAATLTEALAQLDTDGVFLPPEVRDARNAQQAHDFPAVFIEAESIPSSFQMVSWEASTVCSP